MKALILNNKVVDISDTEFETHPSMVWVDCDDTVIAGYDYDGVSFTDPNADTRTNAEIAADDLEYLRRLRNNKLRDTDWWVLPDRTPTQAQLDYRHALRDITKTYTSLDDVVWPENPL